MSKRSAKQGAESVSRDPATYGPVLARRLRLLAKAGLEYDEGDDDQAINMAVILRLLLTDRLIDRVAPIKTMRFTDSAQHPVGGSDNGRIGFGITRVFIDDSRPLATGRVVAPLSNGTTDVEVVYRDWWSRDQVVYPTTGALVTREFVVYEMANTDGVHVDDTLDARYDALSRDNHGFAVNGREISGSVATAAIRQIAWEVQDTIERVLPELAAEPLARDQVISGLGANGQFIRIATLDSHGPVTP